MFGFKCPTDAFINLFRSPALRTLKSVSCPYGPTKRRVAAATWQTAVTVHCRNVQPSASRGTKIGANPPTSGDTYRALFRAQDIAKRSAPMRTLSDVRGPLLTVTVFVNRYTPDVLNRTNKGIC